MKFTPEKETDEEEEIDVCEDTSPQQKNNLVSDKIPLSMQSV